MSRRNRKANYIPLIIESHPDDYDGYPFITLLQYRDKHNLTIIDNATNKEIYAYVLDLCTPVGLDEKEVVEVAAEWHDASSQKYPLSIEFSKRNISGRMSQIFRSYNIDFVTRIIGPLPKFNVTDVISTKKRRKRPVPAGVQVQTYISF